MCEAGGGDSIAIARVVHQLRVVGKMNMAGEYFLIVYVTCGVDIVVSVTCAHVVRA